MCGGTKGGLRDEKRSRGAAASKVSRLQLMRKEAAGGNPFFTHPNGANTPVFVETIEKS